MKHAFVCSTPDSKPFRYRQGGFTLVELSIVLVIIGLLLGGILIGKDMIRAAQLRSLATDIQGYTAASQMFIDKYNCLPGDCTNATTFWSGVTNGNGNGTLDNAGAPSTAGELFGAWQQLALAGYLKGSYTGVAGPGATNHAVLGVNVPLSKFPATGYTWYYFGNYSGNATVYDGNYGHALVIGGQYSNTISYLATLTPQDSYQIDVKIDDGNPALGSLRTYNSGTTTPNCSTGTNSSGSSAVYNIAYTAAACPLKYITGW